MKKSVKRLLAAFLALVMMIGIAAPQPALASNVRLSRANLELYTGYSAALTLKNAENVKWSSTDTAVAKVTQKGVVVAVDEGSCKVHAYDKDTKKTYTCSVKVKRKSFSLYNSMEATRKNSTTYSFGMLKNYIKSELGDTISANVKWVSSDESIIYETENAGLCAVGYGTVVLTAKQGGRTYIYELTITDTPQ